VFYSEKSYETIYGNTTNWNSTGWDEIYQESCKLGVKVLTDSVMITSVQCNDKQSYLFYINVKFREIFRHFEERFGPLNENEQNLLKIHSILHIRLTL
jgi:hypothetical protein